MKKKKPCLKTKSNKLKSSTTKMSSETESESKSKSKASKDKPRRTRAQRRRQRGPFDALNVFRGTTPEDNHGPYLSQFLLIGTPGVDGSGALSDGMVQYGAVRIDQRARAAMSRTDYMMDWDACISL